MAITFTEHFADGSKKEWKGAACFAPMYAGGNKNKTVRVTYTCDVIATEPYSKEKLTKEDLEKFCEFLASILDSKLFTYKIRQEKDLFKIDWDFNTTDLSRPKALLYLTAMRYPHEYSSYVRAIGRTIKKTTVGKFKFFQQCHIDGNVGGYGYGQDAAKAPPRVYHYPDGGHTLMCFSTVPNAKHIPMRFCDFRKNLAEDKKKTVLNFWHKLPTEAA